VGKHVSPDLVRCGTRHVCLLNLDRLAVQAIRFTRALITMLVFSASRTAFIPEM
jgi:hypothetical protein